MKEIIYIDIEEEDKAEGLFWARTVQTYEKCLQTSISVKEKEKWRKKLEKAYIGFGIYHEYIAVKYGTEAYLSQNEIVPPVVLYYSNKIKFEIRELTEKDIKRTMRI